jgi:hypothetical protein
MGFMIMQKQKLSMLMASAAILGSSMVGCSGASLDRRPALSAQNAPSLAPRVEKALAGKDFASALMQAEQLVEAQPNDPAYRALLGRAYLANGRYASARTAFSDALTLGNRDVRTIVSLALAETGLGNAAGARALLASHISDLPAADYGLAMAMAGDPKEGVRALLEAVKQPEATAQTRQNLAYALALAGAWGQARLVAGQDLAARDAEQRIGQWSIAAQKGEEQRVAALLGVAPRGDDSGLPVRLALGSAGSAPVQMASSDLIGEARQDVALAAAAEPAASTETPPAPANAVAEVAQPDSFAVAMTFDAARTSEAPLIRAPSDPMRQAVRAAFKRSAADDAQTLINRTGMSRIAKLTAPAADAEASDWVIQLGAFDNAAIAKEKWARISRGRTSLGEFHQIHSAFTLNGRAFHRLAIRGFADHGSANTLCKSLRAEGQACFVRLDDTDSTRMARAQAKGGTQSASRTVKAPAKQVAARKPSGAGRQVASR